jgi:hypothetical protein
MLEGMRHGGREAEVVDEGQGNRQERAAKQTAAEVGWIDLPSLLAARVEEGLLIGNLTTLFFF